MLFVLTALLVLINGVHPEPFCKQLDQELVTLIKGNIPYDDVPVLTDKCMQCSAIYYAYYEHFKDSYGSWTKCYLNSA